MKNLPSSLYHIHVNEKFPLKRLIELLPYFESLGIDGIYCSPVFEAATPHGYDIVDPNHINSAIGDRATFEKLIEELKKKEMILLLDVVPNHMGIKGKKNKWWQDVLKNGPHSSYAEFFDIDWDPQKPELKNKVLLPVLATPYGEALLNQEIQLEWKDDNFCITYGDYQLPLSEKSLALVKEQGDNIDKVLQFFNGVKGNHESFNALHRLLEAQFYRLAHWLVAGPEINYRRFFNINELIAIHIEKEKVLEAHHRLIFELLEEGKVQGLRIDHPDGLYDPREYFERIQKHGPSFVVIEKILDFKEQIPLEWNIQGTVGYEFLNLLSGLFIKQSNENKFSRIYDKFIGHQTDLELMLYERKKRFINLHMSGEINVLGERLSSLAEKSRYSRDFTRIDLTHALKEVMACFPVYRTYIRDSVVSNRDREYVKQAIERAKQKTPEIDAMIYTYIRDILLREIKEPTPEGLDFVQRFQQQTAPIMAKGLEDSCFYLFNRFVALNEVGGDPANFGISKAEFHQFNAEHLEKWPLSLLPSSTQDTKWSEDARYRLAVLSEMPKKWSSLVFKWTQENQKYKTKIQALTFPDRNTEYYLYQMLLGAWPETSDLPEKEFIERLKVCFLKAIRESAVYTSHEHPNCEYENACMGFLLAIIEDTHSFLPSFLELLKEISLFGKYNSLSSLILKTGSCGIVDIYQGNEEWNYKLMDPDNRKAIDFEKLQKELKNHEAKIWVTQKALMFRHSQKELFLKGEYLPCTIQSERKENVIAFMRRDEKSAALVAAGRFFSELPVPATGKECWKETYLVLPKKADSQILRDIFTDREIPTVKKEGKLIIYLADLFQEYPFAILRQR